MARREKPDIGAGELEILRALWELGPSTVREVVDHLESRRRILAYNTVQTVLGRLCDKNFVTRDAGAHRHVFRARVTREQLGRRRVRDLLQGVYEGATGALVAQLVEQGRLAPDELAELHKLLEDKLEQAGG